MCYWSIPYHQQRSSFSNPNNNVHPAIDVIGAINSNTYHHPVNETGTNDYSKVFELTENQSTYIPQGSLHRLENQQDTALEIIEIQTGSYFGEDDIYRLKDDYKRK